MENLAPVFVCAIMGFTVYRILELYARRKERMTILEKLNFTPDSKALNDRLNLPLFDNVKIPSSWPLRVSLLLIGIGLGLIVAFVLEITLCDRTMLPEFSKYEWDVQNNIKNTVGVIYFACISLCLYRSLIML